MQNTKLLIIINPKAGNGDGKNEWSKIENLLLKNKISFIPKFTERKKHASILAEEFIVNNDGRKIVIVGGDGTVNEVINGIFNQKKIDTTEIYIGLISVGSGNDWGRTLNIPNNIEEAINVIKNQNSVLTDVGKVRFYDYNKAIKLNYFLNVAGVGFDAAVAKKTNLSKEKNAKGNKFSYLLNLFSSLLSYRNKRTRIKIDDSIHKHGKFFSISIGICKYNGGGMKQLPNAIHNDGLLDMTIIGNISKLQVIKKINDLYDGSFINHKKIDTYTAKKINIESTPNSHLEIDGESVGTIPAEFGIIKKAINVYCLKG